MKLWIISFLLPLAFSFNDFMMEEVWIRPLPLSRVALHFDVSIEASLSKMHYDLFPKMIGQMLAKYSTQSLSFSMVSGVWDVHTYGRPFAPSASFGSTLNATVSKNTSASTWQGLKSELAALFSASLVQMDKTTTTVITNMEKDTVTFFATLPREEVCTENLTPWCKLLPCRTHTGLAQLVDTLRTVGADYFDLSLHAEILDNGNVKLRQTLTKVVRMQKEEWSIASLVRGTSDDEKLLVKACPLSTTSRIYVEADETMEFIKKPEEIKMISLPWCSSKKSEKKIGAIYKLSKEVALDMNTIGVRKTQEGTFEQEVVSVHRFITGYGQVHGGLALRITNKHTTLPFRVDYTDHIPWFLRLYFSTVRLSIGGKELDPRAALLDYKFQPAEDHGRPNVLAFAVDLRPNSTLVLSIQFDKVFIQLEQHPRDANRGMDVAGARVIVSSLKTSSFPTYETSLVDAQVSPDAVLILYKDFVSQYMPFYVQSMSCMFSFFLH